MKLAIMQPYIFPYIGYFQLIRSVDKFVMLDDVSYINKGWINRNNILVNGKANLFSIPLKDASQNKLINEIDILQDGKWQSKFLKTLTLSYKKAASFENVYSLIEEIINSPESNISAFNHNAIVKIVNYLSIDTAIVSSSSVYNNQNLKAQNRIIDICLQEKASVYINPAGGVDLYNKEDFKQQGIEFHFIKSGDVTYNQFKNEFVPWLSIIDLLMFNTLEKMDEILNQYELT